MSRKKLVGVKVNLGFPVSVTSKMASEVNEKKSGLKLFQHGFYRLFDLKVVSEVNEKCVCLKVFKDFSIFGLKR